MDETVEFDPSGIEFPFPYSRPYDIQLKFMQSLYKTLEMKRIGIFESPTGTGKSLSIICGSLKWLADFKKSQQRQLEKLVEEEENEKKKKNEESNAFDWLTDHQVNFEKNRKNAELKIKLEKQTKTEKTYQDLKTKAKANRKQREKLKDDMNKKILQAKLMNAKSGEEDKEADDLKLDLGDAGDDKFNEDLEIILDDYRSDEEDDFDFGDDEDDENDEPLTKIFFCSRTHSQITQFIGELGKTAFAENTRLVTLGSRMNLCINDVVLKLTSIQAVNDRCLELQKNKKSTNKSGSKRSKLDSDKSCPYYKTNLYEHFTLKLMEEIFDIEDAAKAGREVKICPYYGARHSIPAAEIVCLPYNILFQAESRKSFSINLKNQIVIIDEAHNLIDTIASIHGVEISDNHVNQAHTQLTNYINKYKSRFSAKNMLYLRQLLSVLTGLQKLMNPKNEDVKFETENGKISLKMSKMWTVSDFLVHTKFFNLNFVKLLRFCDQVQLEKKLMGFGEKYSASKDKEAAPEVKIQSGKTKENEATSAAPAANAPPVLKSPLMQIKQLIKMLSTPVYDGRLLLAIDAGRSSLKYILLNPNICFEEIAAQARSVVLAGGTMKPLADFEHLIGSDRKIEYFSCGHVIPKENITVLAMSSGPNNFRFDFSYNSRDNPQMLDELGKQLLSLASIVPDGMVVFFVSYDYLDKIVRHFKKSGVFDQLNEKKQIFSEPRLSSECDKVFSDYTKCVKKPKPNSKQNGAMLFAVVGGKMSEGINFSDELGRCVIVVGLPYANVKSIELQEKIQYLNKHQPKGEDGKLAGQQYYESICWKAINQSIGRAIRHQNDYASILLIDARYCNQPLASLKEKLPQWIGESLRQEQAPVFDNKKISEHLVKFFEAKKNK